MLTLAFHPRHIQDVRNGSKRLTARINFERKIRQGDEIRFIDSSNNQIFGSGTVIRVYKMDINEFIDTDWEYHRNYKNRHEFNRAFSEYYPDVDLDTIDVVTVIEWGKFFRENRVYDFG